MDMQNSSSDDDLDPFIETSQRGYNTNIDDYLNSFVNEYYLDDLNSPMAQN